MYNVVINNITYGYKIMAGFIAYDIKSSGIYAKLCISKRVGTRVTKSYVCLGRVLDKERHIFRNRERGVFTYDPKTGKYGNPPEDFVPEEIPRKNRAELLNLDFGDAFFLDSFIKQERFDRCVEALGYDNPDIAKAMLLFYILSCRSNAHAPIWYEGSYARILYPKANLSSQRISDFLESIGNESKWYRFFETYVQWLCGFKETKKNEHILIDSTGLPNSTHFPLTALSNHNGELSSEVRLIYVVQQKTGMPLYLRYCPGNIIDANTVVRTIAELKEHKINVKFAILDAEYYTAENLDTFFENHISFITRLKENRRLYKDLIAKYGTNIKQEENSVRFGSRFLYVKHVDCELSGRRGTYKAHAYIAVDLSRAFDEECQAIKHGAADDLDPREVHRNMQGKGFFVLVATHRISTEDILLLYYTRQQIEQVFDIGKNYASMLLDSVQKEAAFRGHLMMTFMAAVVCKKLQKLAEQHNMTMTMMLESLKNQKCKIYNSRVITNEPNKQQNAAYKIAGITCPAVIPR